MRLPVALPLCLLLLASSGWHAVADLPVAAAGEPEIVSARLAWEPGRVASASVNKIPFGDKPPADTILPTGLAKPRYARIRMAGTRGLAIALDATPESPRLWVDHDFDGNLMKEKRVWMRAQGSMFRREQVVLVSYPDEPAVTRVTLHFTYFPAAEELSVTVYASAHRRGTVVLGGRLRLMALADGNSDLRFDDPKKDGLYIDLDGNGRFDTTGEAPDRVVPGEVFRVGTEGWIATVPGMSGRVVEFTRAATVPPAKPRKWPTRGTPTPGRARTPPTDSFKVLSRRFTNERNKPYADRYATVNLLAGVGTEAAFKLLRRIGDKDKDKNIRLAAIRAMGNPAYLDFGGKHVLGLASGGEAGSQGAAAAALFGMGHPGRFSIYKRLVRSGQQAAVTGAISYLAYMRTKASREAVLRAFDDAAVGNVRYSVYVSGVRNLQGGPPPDVMLRAVADDYVALRAAALDDLHVIGHPDARALALGMAEVRPVAIQVGQAVARVLGAAGDGASVNALLALFGDENLHAHVQAAILKQLRFLRAPAAIGALVVALKAKSATLRTIAAEILASVPTKETTAALLKQAKRERDFAAAAAQLEALGDHGDPNAIRLLLKYAQKRASKDVTKRARRRAAIRALARMGLGHEEVRAFFLRLLAAKDWRDRVLALDAARDTGDQSLIPKVVANLDHEAWQVRLAAIGALDGLRGKAAIAPLIARLSEETEERLRDAIADALFRLTAQMLYDNAVIWQRWWDRNGTTFKVPETIPERIDSDVGGTGAGFYGIPVKTNRVVFVIDQSGSMMARGADPIKEGGPVLNRLDVAIREVLAAMGKLKDRARVNVILFHTTIHPWKPKLVPLGHQGRSALKRHLVGKRPTGGTNLYDGLELALELRDVDTIFLLSDGVPGAGKYIATKDILRAVRRLNQTRRIAIHGISIGMDSDLLKRLAAENGGRYARR